MYANNGNMGGYNIIIKRGTYCEVNVPEFGAQVLQDVADSFPSEYDVYVAKAAMPTHGIWRLFRPTMCDSWLATEGKIDIDTAREMIKLFPFLAHPRLDHNAMNLHRFLGIAAALARKPDIIVFETSGMDPQGVMELRDYIQVRIGEIFVVQVCWPPVEHKPWHPRRLEFQCPECRGDMEAGYIAGQWSRLKWCKQTQAISEGTPLIKNRCLWNARTLVARRCTKCKIGIFTYEY